MIFTHCEHNLSQEHRLKPRNYQRLVSSAQFENQLVSSLYSVGFFLPGSRSTVGVITRDLQALISRKHWQTNRRGLHTMFLTWKYRCRQKISSVDALLIIHNVLSWSGRFGGGHTGWSQLQSHHCEFLFWFYARKLQLLMLVCIGSTSDNVYFRVHTLRHIPSTCIRAPFSLKVGLVQSHHSEVLMDAIASQNTSLTSVYSIVYSSRSKKASKFRDTGLYAGNSPVTG